MGNAEKEGLAQLRDRALMEQMIRVVGDPIIKQDLRRIALNFEGQPFNELRYHVLRLYPGLVGFKKLALGKGQLAVY